jgi:hypothetical protein
MRPMGATSTLPPGARPSSPAAASEEIDLELPIATEVEEVSEEISFSMEAEPPRRTPSETTAPRLDPKSTLVRGGDEAADLRRRIGQPVPMMEPELSLEAIDEEDVDIEELTLEPAPPAPVRPPPAPPRPPAPAMAPPPAPRPPVAPPAVRPAPMSPSPAPAVARPSVPVPRPLPAPAPVAARANPPAPAAPTSISTAPVAVHVGGTPGQTDISIPVDVIFNNGTARVQIHLRLTLNLKLQG